MRKYIVVTDEYIRYGEGKLTTRLIKVGDDYTTEKEELEQLARILEPDAEEDVEHEETSHFQYLKDANGDGCNYYLIHEIVGDELVEILG